MKSIFKVVFSIMYLHYNEFMQETEKYLWKRVNRYLKFLRWIPFLRMVAVCNNLSFGRVSEKSDIDLFVIARSGRLFIVRSLVTGVLHVLGVRRHGKKIAGRFCLSFFVDDSRLNLSDIAIQKDIYLAFWIKSLLPVLDDGVSKSFFENNAWAKYFFEREDDFQMDYSRVISRKNLFRKFLEKILSGRFGSKLEGLLMNWQLKRARARVEKVKTESGFIIEQNILKFHNLDRRRLYSEKWARTFGEDARLTSEKFLSL